MPLRRFWFSRSIIVCDICVGQYSTEIEHGIGQECSLTPVITDFFDPNNHNWQGMLTVRPLFIFTDMSLQNDQLPKFLKKGSRFIKF
ncbi:ANM_HP_G0242920.mRNA.1.CDS.1 [Saccharomyces cerevisiae]|nr:ANM_HP_G0242920.mRNA.1.CDS.1 [Saccharomyces cerevisiae]CAI7002521.1 ANM_HP_G0242920.mRNA.1.CDS.1 [Saccharomyces cerevisiae]